MASWTKATTQQEGGGGSEPELKSAPGCASNAKEHGRPHKSIWCALCKKDKPENAGRNDVATAQNIGLLVRSALPEELNQMAAGGDVKETVMTIPFLRACITK